MGWMFSNCKSLQTLELSSFNTSNVTDMMFMFWGCESLKTLDISSFDMSNFKNTYNMLSGCNSLRTVKIPKDKKSMQKIIDQLDEDGIQCNII